MARDNFYDEDDGQDADDGESRRYESFLAPKNAFPPDSLKPGAIHEVRVERIMDDEVVLRCIENGEPEESGEGEMMAEPAPATASENDPYA